MLDSYKFSKVKLYKTTILPNNNNKINKKILIFINIYFYNI